MPDDEGDDLPPPERLPDGSVVGVRVTDGGAGAELSVETAGRVIRFPVERTRPPDEDDE